MALAAVSRSTTTIPKQALLTALAKLFRPSLSKTSSAGSTPAAILWLTLCEERCRSFPTRREQPATRSQTSGAGHSAADRGANEIGTLGRPLAQEAGRTAGYQVKRWPEQQTSGAMLEAHHRLGSPRWLQPCHGRVPLGLPLRVWRSRLIRISAYTDPARSPLASSCRTHSRILAAIWSRTWRNFSVLSASLPSKPLGSSNGQYRR